MSKRKEAKEAQEGNKGKEPKDMVAGKFKESLTQAIKIKRDYLAVNASSNTILAQIKAQAAGWGWADNEVNKGKLKERLAGLQSGLNDFGRRFLLEEVGELKKDTKQERQQQELDHFLMANGP